jgi:hypothetical protein
LRVESAQFGIIDKLEDPENQGLPGGTILADMSESTAAGELRWKYREPGFDIPPQSCVAVEVGKQFRSQSACTIASPDGATYNVEPGYLIDVLPNRLVIRDALGVQVPPK